MGAPMAYPMQPPMMAAEPPEVQSIKSMLHVARIIVLIFGIILIVAGAVLIIALIGIVPLIFGFVDILIYLRFKEIETMVNQHQYEAAKSRTLVWMIIGFILGGLLPGIFALIAYVKFDPVIAWQRSQGAMPPQGYAPQYAAPPAYAAPAAAPVAPSPPPAAAPAAAPAPFCVKCGKPTTYIAQYGRYYCYDDNLYA